MSAAPLHGAPTLRHLYLTWQRDPSRTITLNIHGINTPETLHVYYDTEPHHSKIGRYAHKVQGSGAVFQQLPDGRRLYHIELPGLQPATAYYFTVGDSRRAYGNEQSFRTIAEKSEKLLIVEGGDWENTRSAEALAKKAASLDPHAVWLGGDYPSSVHGLRDYKKWDHWLDVYTRSMVTSEGHLIPLVMAIGNHEVLGGFNQPKTQAPFFFRYFKQGDTEESYFSLPFGDAVQLIVLDSGHTAPHAGEQTLWLEETLKKASHKPVKVALYHVPLYPSIRFAEKGLSYRSTRGFVELVKGKNSANKLFSKESQEGRRFWLPLFDQYRLTAAFEHHDQTLKRTKLLRHGREDPTGTLYLGDGGWGPKVQFPTLQGYFQNYFAHLQGKQHFFWVMEVKEGEITYVALTASGQVLDRFTQKI
ncbi:MAG: hypothetical protein S4CHLAM2_13120 [Chlamydiales bacterium]|nr:hypothetical protein [Chlamydiales bacterium]